LHTALAPHGDGLQGFLGPSVGAGAGKIKSVIPTQYDKEDN
jgi:hypothetical protein